MNTASVEVGFGIFPVKGRDFLLMIHVWLPMALGWSLAMVFQNANGKAVSHAGLALLLAGIGAAYSFDRVIDVPKGHLPAWLQPLLLCALVLSTGTICVLGTLGKIDSNSVLVVAILTGMSLSYLGLKRLPFAKSTLLAICWTWACATLPFSAGGKNWLFLDATPPLLLLISAGCVLCDLKDIREDQDAGVPTLPAILGIHFACLIATGLAFLAAILAFHHHLAGVGIGSLLLAAAAQFPRILVMRLTGPILVDSILIIPGLLIAMGFS
jgi:hypothetical protein